MRYLVDVVTEALGTEDPAGIETSVEADEQTVLERLARNHAQWQPSAPPKKKEEFVPGWRLDVSDGNPWGRDPYFVVRAILYAHRIALSDPLGFHMSPLGGAGPIGGFGFKEALLKILWYAPLERAGLLFYVPPGVPPEVDPFVSEHYSDEVLEQFFRDYMAPTGRYRRVPDDDWGKDTVDTRLARMAANTQLALGLHGAQTLLAWQREHRRSIDLYAPDGLFRDALEWLIRKSGSSLLTSKIDRPENAAMRALWELPTPSAEAYQSLTVRDLLLIREDAAFSDWRDALTSGLEAYVISKAVNDDPAAVIAFANELEARRGDTVRAANSHRAIREMAGAAGTFGVGAVIGGGVSVAIQHETLEQAAAAATAAAIGAAVAAAPMVVRVVRSLADGHARKAAVDQHFRLFGTD